eukprot:4944350-Ditylum_brightwellii.AAC.1
MFCKFARGWTVALGAFIGVIVGLTFGAHLGGMVVLMPWSGQAVFGVGIHLTLRVACVFLDWKVVMNLDE